MGQKVHPYGFRLGYNKTWRSRWYAERDYGKLLHEDLRLKKALKKRFSHAGVSRVEIERAANKLKINIHTSRPGIIIGRKGTEVDKLKARCSGEDQSRGLYQHHRGGETRARCSACGGIHRSATRQAYRFPPSHATLGGSYDAIRRAGHQGPLLGSTERCRDRSVGVVLDWVSSRFTRCAPTSTTALRRPSRPTDKSVSSAGFTRGTRFPWGLLFVMRRPGGPAPKKRRPRGPVTIENR